MTTCRILFREVYWYEGPNFKVRHYVGSAKRYGEYYDDFSTLPFRFERRRYYEFYYRRIVRRLREKEYHRGR